MNKVDVVLQYSLAFVRAHNLTRMTNAEQIHVFSGWFTILWGWRGVLSRLFAEKVTVNLKSVCNSLANVAPHMTRSSYLCILWHFKLHSALLWLEVSIRFLPRLLEASCLSCSGSVVCLLVTWIKSSPASHYPDFLVRNRCFFLLLLLMWFSCYQPHYWRVTSICVIILIPVFWTRSTHPVK